MEPGLAHVSLADKAMESGRKAFLEQMWAVCWGACIWIQLMRFSAVTDKANGSTARRDREMLS